ncbi:arsenate-mycothiol transferase ArsC [Actinokineospora bangkokensis]|uniref:Phosphotyrosine protein phosphatase I domain-containing protein n=1 Tax=Actinokineospora bangkokensis TaxID=1193682 RepID=A0A1Q9LNV5_9PSEU|nr:hypothetical protein [Actinokineospora bangkokensis]OLR93695.1 hypothetical protein BJP25_15670 [Actinokineospora bangkokensis]
MTTSSNACRILVVCDDNQRRSPLVQAMLGARLRRVRGTRWQISSAGTDCDPGDPVDRDVAPFVPRPGLDVDRFRTRRLTADLARDGEVIITMTRLEAASAMRLDPTAIRRTVTLAELARCAGRLGALETGRGRAAMLELVRLAIRDRGPTRPDDPAEDDITGPSADPRLLPATVHQLSTAVDAISALVNDAHPAARSIPAQRGQSTRASLARGR